MHMIRENRKVTATAINIKPKKTQRVASGVSTNGLIFSAFQGTNDEVFPHVLQLYVPPGRPCG